jgi:cytosine/adenosine deaminase-related metal-dependent hydrolase
MILEGLKIPDIKPHVDIHIKNGKISKILLSQQNYRHDEAGLIAFPGLINSHDHLDFNLFPQLGERTYQNYREWGLHLHTHYKASIKEVLKIPYRLRVQWGYFKNLLCGVTTVVHHGSSVADPPDFITVYQNLHNLHSVQFEPLWKLKLNNVLKKEKDCVIHTGEGIDENSEKEIDQLIKWNLLNRQLIGIHGIAMNTRQAKKFKALIWCPDSNYFMFDRTANIQELKHHTNIVFGTDSTLTADWDIWNHIRSARREAHLNDEELFHSLTTVPSTIWSLPYGRLLPGQQADIVIARGNKSEDYFSNFYHCTPETIQLVVKEGKIVLIDSEMALQLQMDSDRLKQFAK